MHAFPFLHARFSVSGVFCEDYRCLAVEIPGSCSCMLVSMEATANAGRCLCCICERMSITIPNISPESRLPECGICIQLRSQNIQAACFPKRCGCYVEPHVPSASQAFSYAPSK